MSSETSGLDPARLSRSRLIIGCEPLGGTDWGEFDEHAVVEAIEHAAASGVGGFDTADVYGLGGSERRLGAALKRSAFQGEVITKVGVRWEMNPSGRARTWVDNSPEYLSSALSASGERLGPIDDLTALVHWPEDPRGLDDAALEVLEDRCDAGFLTRYGVSNFATDAAPPRTDRCVTYQRCLNLLSSPDDHDAMTAAHAAGYRCLAYGPLAQGLLTGKYDSSSVFGPDDRRHRLPHFTEWTERTDDIIDELRDAAADIGAEPAAIALAWVNSQPAIDAVIVGCKSVAQVDAAIAAIESVDAHRAAARLRS